MIEDRIAEHRTQAWQSRIVGYGRAAPADLLANPYNFRLHPAEQQAALEGVLDQVGWVEPVVVNRTTGHILNGHLRVTLAMRHGELEIDVAWIEMSEDEERLTLALLDKLAGMAAVDGYKLDALLKQIEEQAAPVQIVLEGMAADAEALIARVAGAEGAGPELTISPELFERHDYLVFYFDNDLDWQVACAAFAVEQVKSGQVGRRTLEHKGIGRVISGARLLEAVERDR